MDISLDLIRSVFNAEPEPVAQIVTIVTDAPTTVRATDWPEGITSAGVAYPYFPFELAWAGAAADTPFGEGRLSIANIDAAIETACEAAGDPPTITVGLVRVAAPDTVEKAIEGATIRSIEGDEVKISAVIRPKDFNEEPACKASYTPSRTPGLF